MIDKINPSVKTIAILTTSLLLGFFSSFKLNIFIICLGFLFLFTSKMAKFKDYKFILLSILILSFAFFMAGFKFNASMISGESNKALGLNWENGLNLGTRICAFGLLGISYSKTTDKLDLIYSFNQQLKLKDDICYGILSAINLIPKLKKDLDRVKLSYNVRGIKTNSLSIKPIFTLLVRSVRFSDNIAEAMESKGFGSNRSHYKKLEVRLIDYIFAISLILVTLIFGIISYII